MQLSHATAFWLRLAGNILLDLFLYVHMFCSPRCAHEIIRRLILLPLARAGGPDRCCVGAFQNSQRLEMCGAPRSGQRGWSTCTPSRVHIPDVSSYCRQLWIPQIPSVTNAIEISDMRKGTGGWVTRATGK